MPARDRTDAVDWSAVEAWATTRAFRWATQAYDATAEVDKRRLGHDAAMLTDALAAVRLVRALEEGKVTSLMLLEARSVNRWVATRSRGTSAGPLYSAGTPLAAVTRALDASKGEG